MESTGIPGTIRAIQMKMLLMHRNVWMALYSVGVGVFDGTSISYYNTFNSPIPSSLVADIEMDNNGDFWILAGDGLTHLMVQPGQYLILRILLYLQMLFMELVQTKIICCGFMEI